MELFSGYCYAKNTKSRLANFLYNNLKKKPVLLCIGSDKILADCLAPITAELLRKQNFPFYVYGGLTSPINTKNAEFACDFIHSIHPNNQLVIIDSMTTTLTSRLGTILVSNTYKGAINNINLQADLFIYGITSLLDKTTNLLTNSRLSIIEKIASILVSSFMDVIAFNNEFEKTKSKCIQKYF